MPGQAREPLPKGMKKRSKSGLSIHLSGTKFFALGKIHSFMRMSTLVIEIGVFAGIIQSPYLSSRGARRGERVEIPWANLTASWTQPLRYGRRSNLCQSNVLEDVDITLSNSVRSLWETLGLLIIWKLATVNAQDVVMRPAATISCASSPRRASDFSSGGRSLLSNSWKIVGWLTCLCASLIPCLISPTCRARS
jgi:hypothetical protein